METITYVDPFFGFVSSVGFGKKRAYGSTWKFGCIFAMPAIFYLPFNSHREWNFNNNPHGLVNFNTLQTIIFIRDYNHKGHEVGEVFEGI